MNSLALQEINSFRFLQENKFVYSFKKLMILAVYSTHNIDQKSIYDTT